MLSLYTMCVAACTDPNDGVEVQPSKKRYDAQVCTGVAEAAVIQAAIARFVSRLMIDFVPTWSGESPC